MKILDPGHIYEIPYYDLIPRDRTDQVIRFVKRNKPPEKYPGNDIAYPGTLMQDVIRVLIDRLKYVDNQNHHELNNKVLSNFRKALKDLELRTLLIRMKESKDDRYYSNMQELITHECVEELDPCNICGHVLCIMEHKNEENSKPTISSLNISEL